MNAEVGGKEFLLVDGELSLLTLVFCLYLLRQITAFLFDSAFSFLEINFSLGTTYFAIAFTFSIQQMFFLSQVNVVLLDIADLLCTLQS